MPRLRYSRTATVTTPAADGCCRAVSGGFGGDEARDVVAQGRKVDTRLDEDPGREPLTFAEQAQQHMPLADGPATRPQRLPQGELKDLLGAPAERDVARRHLVAATAARVQRARPETRLGHPA